MDIQSGVIDLHSSKPSLKAFSLTGGAISCGSSSEFPYPATENWQKAIGGHTIWLSGNVIVHEGTPLSKPKFELSMTLHAEDRYNFNPGQHDIATGIPDSDNGIFEMTGLAHQFEQFSILKRVIVWYGTQLGIASSKDKSWGRERQNSENRRVRNRL